MVSRRAPLSRIDRPLTVAAEPRDDDTWCGLRIISGCVVAAVISLCTCMHVSVCMYVCIYVHMYGFVNNILASIVSTHAYP